MRSGVGLGYSAVCKMEGEANERQVKLHRSGSCQRERSCAQVVRRRGGVVVLRLYGRSRALFNADVSCNWVGLAKYVPFIIFPLRPTPVGVYSFGIQGAKSVIATLCHVFHSRSEEWPDDSCSCCSDVSRALMNDSSGVSSCPSYRGRPYRDADGCSLDFGAGMKTIALGAALNHTGRVRFRT